MGWFQFIIFLALIAIIFRWLRKEFKASKIAREQAATDRKEMLQSIKKIEVSIVDLDKVLNPIEKRHFR